MAEVAHMQTAPINGAARDGRGKTEDADSAAGTMRTEAAREVVISEAPVETASRPWGKSLYRRVLEAVGLYEDSRWRAEHFGDDPQPAARYLERELVPEVRDSWVEVRDLGKLLKRFPNGASWRRAGNTLDVLADQLRDEERAAVQRQGEQTEREQRRADRRERRRLLEGTLKVSLLLGLRDGGWHGAHELGERLDAHFDCDGADGQRRRELARRFFLQTGGDGQRPRDEQAAAGQRGLSRQLVARLLRQGLIESRSSERVNEVRATPREPACFRLDREWEGLLPRVQADEERLTEHLVNEGRREPLLVWRGVLLDGYRQLRLCLLLGWPYETKKIDFPDRAAATAFRWKKHYGPTVTRQIQSYVRGRLYNLAKQAHGGWRRAEGASSDNPNSQSVDFTLCVKGENPSSGNPNSERTARRLAREHGVNPDTIVEDGHYAVAVDRVAEVCGDQIRDWVLSRVVKWARVDLLKLAALEPAAMQKKVDEALEGRKRPTFADPPEKKKWIQVPLNDAAELVRRVRENAMLEQYAAICRAFGATRPELPDDPAASGEIALPLGLPGLFAERLKNRSRPEQVQAIVLALMAIGD